MEPSRFDTLVRSFAGTATRRGALAALAAALAALPALGTEAKKGGKGKSKGKGKGDGKSRENGHGKGNKAKTKDRRKRAKSRHGQAQTEAVCFGGSPCTIGPSANLTKCDFANGAALQGATCTSCNLSGANLSKANASGANLKSANLGKACLVDANLTGANLSSANLTGAVLCRTTMPNGSINNSGCNKATNCCLICTPLGASGCGLGGGCCNGGICQGDVCACPDGRQNCDGACVNVQTDAKHCGSCGNACAVGERCCGGVCKQVQSDTNNCGACGNVCPGGQGCCGGVCTNLQTDANCGACGNACDGTDTCQGGRCVCDPAPCAAAGGCCVEGSCDFDGGVWGNQTAFGTSGTGKREFDSPTGVAIVPDGLTAWVTDQGNHRVAIWANSGGVWDVINEFGSGPGADDDQFDIPTGVAVSTDGKTAWVADTGNHRVSIWVISGIVWTNLTTFGKFGTERFEFNLPRGVAVSADGKTAWVADQGNHRISVWTNTGGGWNPLTTFGGFGSGLGQLNNPQAVAIAPDGLTAWVADSSNNRVSIWINTGGTWTNPTTFGSSGTGPIQFNNPRGVAVSPDGETAWVVDGFNHRVSVWTNAGGTWSNLTIFGGGQGPGANQFNLPFGVAVTAGGETAWVADSANDRVSIWTLTCPAI